MLAFGLTCLTQTNTFNNIGGTGFWITDNNWSEGHQPTVSEDVVIPNTFSVTIQNTTSAVAKTVEVKTGGSLTILGTLTIEEPPPPPVPTVTNPTTGKTWMDRNLGASQVATSTADEDAYGDLYQWGRATEGHEFRTSDTYGSQATTAAPNEGNEWDGKFIIYQTNWLNVVDNTLWTESAPGGTNNPCPSGFRLPTETEWTDEKNSWASQNPEGAFGSVLKIPASGRRDQMNGGPIIFAGVEGNYWSSSTNGDPAKSLIFAIYGAFTQDDDRGWGYSVRCIKD